VTEPGSSARQPVSWPESLDVVGSELSLPLVDGRCVTGVDFDRAATTPCLVVVEEAVRSFLPWYGSVHRGAGCKSSVTTDVFEGARQQVAGFLGARDDDTVAFVRNTTEAANLLAHVVEGAVDVVVFEIEHHANLLPWRRSGAEVLDLPPTRAELLDKIEERARVKRSRPWLLALTAVSNVTGELLPIADAAEIVHRGGGRIFVDAAQLAAHKRIDMAASGIDYLAMSGHKLYAPFGSGVLVGRRDWLERSEPLLHGGGAVILVTSEGVSWKPAPDRLEAGTPNVLGAVALAAACRALSGVGMDVVEELESILSAELDAALELVPTLSRLTMWGLDGPHVGVACFEVASVEHGLVAAVLGAEHGIAVRHGCFCAHLLVRDLLHVSRRDATDAAHRVEIGDAVRLPGAVRASIGVGTSLEDIARLSKALIEIVQEGPRWTYCSTADGEMRPDPDPRVLPGFDDLVAARSNGDSRRGQLW